MLRNLFIFLLLVNSLLLAEEEIYDPWENMNRSIFSFNEGLDKYLMQPVARTYDDALPRPVRNGITNFFDNLRYPQYLVSDLVQLKFSQAAKHTARFVTNTVFGLAGIFDVATEFGLKKHNEDFGLALAYNGVPSGPYLILPVVGPSNVRDSVGFVVDRFLNPMYWVGYIDEWDNNTQLAVSIGASVLEAVNTRANLLEAIDAARDSSLDYYLFMQSSYSQIRENLLYDGNVPGSEDDPFDDPFE